MNYKVIKTIIQLFTYRHLLIMEINTEYFI
jgi:hypothetical protein